MLALTGGGSKALTELLSVPGASATVLDASIPYHSEALETYLGQGIETAASSLTARNLAMAAWLRACTINKSQENVVGVGATCALTTNRRRLGNNRCFIALQTSSRTEEIKVVLNDGVRTRQSEENLVSDLIIHQIAKCCGLQTPRLEFPEKIVRRCHDASEIWSRLLTGKQKTTLSSPHSINLFPGAFNPLHQGHEEIIAYSEKLLQGKVYLEVSIDNVDKLPIDFLTMQDRQEQLNGKSLIYTNAPTFIEKARLFPESCFILGVDTLLRIINKKYYDNDEALLASSIEEIYELGCKMLVFGRNVNGHFLTVDNLTLPENVNRLCTGVNEEDFRNDVSSTLLREHE